MTESAQLKPGALIRQTIESLRSGRAFTSEERKKGLRLLSDYECWLPYLDLLQHAPKEGKSSEPELLTSTIESIRVHNIHLGHRDEAVKLCKKMLSGSGLTFEDFLVKVLPEIIEDGHYHQEVNFCRKIADSFSSSSCKIRCLEHIALLYDKRIHNENALSETYEKILARDPKNVRALRYFKVLHTQTGDWEEVTKTLKMLLLSVQYPEEGYRVAQELAGVLLYQLQEPNQAIQLLERYCAKSPLDTSTIQYDAYASLKNWAGCLKVLKRCLESVSEDNMKAILWFRMGQLYKQLDRKGEALDSFRSAADLWPQFLEPLEEAIHLHLDSKNWVQLEDTLGMLCDRVRGEEYLKKINQLKKIVGSELRHGT